MPSQYINTPNDQTSYSQPGQLSAVSVPNQHTAVNSNTYQPAVFDKTVPPPNYQQQTDVNNEPYQRPAQISKQEGQNYYRPVCKDYVNGKCFSDRCIYYHPKKVSRSRQNVPQRKNIPSIFELQINCPPNQELRNPVYDLNLNTDQNHTQHQREYQLSIQNNMRNRNVRFYTENQPTQTYSSQNYSNKTPQNRNLESGSTVERIHRSQSNRRSNSPNSHPSQRNTAYNNHRSPTLYYSDPRSRSNNNHHQYLPDITRFSSETISHPRNSQNSDRTPVCKFYLRNDCRIGNFCRFSHQLPNSY